MKKDFRIVFMGTPDFASHILKALCEHGANIVAVVTVADKPAGRGQQITESAVKLEALKQGIPVLQPTNLKDDAFRESLASFQADLFVVVAFRMLPESIWAMPPAGTINLHASLLPNYRGAAPIHRAVMNGETETGVSTFFIEKEIDTGKLIEQRKITIGPNDTVGKIYTQLMELGAETTCSTVDKIQQGDIQPIAQSQLIEGHEKSAHKLFKPDCEINWNQPAKNVHDFIRGLDPFPSAWCTLYNKAKNETKSFKFFASEQTHLPSDTELRSNAQGLLFPCSDFYVLIKEIQPEGKRKMDAQSFLAGNSLADWQMIASKN
jgi:methionyl-tRNA formyltransferase